MKRNSTIFLQIVIVLIGLGVLALMLWEPHLEGRNANATFSEIYFNDPFLAYVYIVSILFFTALYQIFKILGYIRENKTFSQVTVKALQTIKYCGLGLAGFIFAAQVYLFVVIRGEDDIAGGVAMSLLLLFISAIMATAAAVFERTVQNAVDIKTENDLTV